MCCMQEAESNLAEKERETGEPRQLAGGDLNVNHGLLRHRQHLSSLPPCVKMMGEWQLVFL